MTKKILFAFFFFQLFFNFGYAQIKNIGIPFIRNFPKREYKAGTQNWSIAQDKRGFMYFANNEGLVVFDGIVWHLYKMPNSSITRSVYIDENESIYIGAYNELGKMVFGSNGKLEFKSLKKYIPAEYQNFDDIWNIISFEGKIIFQSYSTAFVYDNDTSFTIIKAPVRFQNSYKVNEKLYFNDIEKGLFELVKGKLVPLTGCQILNGEEIWSILPYSGVDELLITTLTKGVFIYKEGKLDEWKVPVNDYLKKNQVFSAILLQDHYYAFGTIQDGILITNARGEIIQQINRKKGLQNNTVLKVFADRSGDLWLGLDNGIDYVNINSPITFLKQSEGIGAGYTSIIHQGKLYLGTNQGLFVKDWDGSDQNSTLKMIPNTSGQVWYLGVHDGILICGHNNGTFVIEGETARQISKIPGGWKYHIMKRFPNYLICGTYSGMILFKKENGTWNFVNKVKGFNESFRVFEEDSEGNIWMSHGFKGIYKITFGSNLESIKSFRYYTTNDGLPTNYNLNVFKINEQIIFTTNAGIYQYNPQNERFEKSVYFNQLLSPITDFSYIKEDKDGNIWYVAWYQSNNKAGVFRMEEGGSLKHITSPFILLNSKFISGFESVYPYSDDHLFLGTEDGFAHYSPTAHFRSNPEFSAFITKAIATNIDSTFFYGNNHHVLDPLVHQLYSFRYPKNAFKFYFSSPIYDTPESVEYSFKLAGLNNDWSAWSSSTSVEFALLPEGAYVFSVKARNSLGVESNIDELPFSVRPPWYRSIVAIIGYIILFIIFTLFAIRLFIKRIEISKRKERLKHLKAYRQKERNYIQQVSLSEEKIIRLKNEKLKSEVIHRDKELANQTMDLIRKNKFLAKIKEELEKIKMASTDELLKEKISSLVGKIDKDIDHNKQWEVFETAFDDVHEDFLNRLKARFPTLTPKELRLCAYLRMNISTKEIAPLMNISIRGVEICRYRVRKKLNIDRDTNLTSLIIDL
ncbi:MAG TPA: triple tyrosine motif-containing protein [Prolixibacteraceae bacterium]|nr:triple tyrosine motif-containing protein [Prolixibacteraceae bacterium]